MATKTAGAGSYRELGRLVGRDHSTVYAWVKRDDRWKFGPPPWTAATVAKIRAWVATTLTTDGTGADGAPTNHFDTAKLSIERKVNVALKDERRRRVKLEREILEGKYHLIDECTRRRVLQIEEVKREFLAAGDRIAPMLRNTPPARFAEVINAELARICRNFAGEEQ